MNKDTLAFFALILLIVLLKISNVQPFNSLSWLWILSPLWVVMGLGVIILFIKRGIKQ
jgi:hypothetical protein